MRVANEPYKGAAQSRRSWELALLTDNAVVLFCHIACFCAEGVGDRIVAPYAAVAISGPRRRDRAAR
jgi:hypothetical protein